MDKDKARLLHSEVTEQIIGVFYDVYNELGHGFIESVYENALVVALDQAGLSVNRQVPISVWYRGVHCGDFRADLVVKDVVLLELKAAKSNRVCLRKTDSQLSSSHRILKSD